jgi:hypothetical protein
MSLTVQELAEEVRESNRRLTISSNLAGFQGRTETSFKVAVWGIGVATTVALSVIASVAAGAWYASKLDSRVTHVESRLGGAPGVAPIPKPIP